MAGKDFFGSRDRKSVRRLSHSTTIADGRTVTLTVLSYASRSFRRSQDILLSSVRQHWPRDVTCRSLGPKDIDPTFRRDHSQILSQRRGAGYWLWKPYVILKTLETLSELDVLVYLDAGVRVIASYDVSKLVTPESPIFIPRTHTHLNCYWTKREFLEILDCEVDSFLRSEQCAAGMQIYMKTPKSVEFAKSYLELCCDEHLLLDDTRTPGNERPEFSEHRHDQTVLSYLVWTNGIPAHRDPSQFGNAFNSAFPEDRYPQIFDQHRYRTMTIWQRIQRKTYSLGNRLVGKELFDTSNFT